jgi:hypothetical protein
MMLDVIFDERSNEKIAVVVALQKKREFNSIQFNNFFFIDL